MRIAIYDLDETLTQRATFTPFLLYAAARHAPLRLLFAPLWLAMMLGYKLGLYDRRTLKIAGMRLLVGRCPEAALADICTAFAAKCAAALKPGAQRQWKTDGDAGYRRVVATAALDIYAVPLGKLLNADAVIATAWHGNNMVGDNCYGPAKLARVQQWLAEQNLGRDNVHIRTASDSFADAPLLGWSNEAWFVTRSPQRARKAAGLGWTAVNFDD